MNITMAVSDDCRRLVKSLAERLDLALYTLLAPILKAKDHNFVDRLMWDRDTKNRKRKIWPSVCVEMLADITAGVTPFKAADVLSSLLYPERPVDPELKALVRHSQYYLHNSAITKSVLSKMVEISHGAKKIVSCEGPLRLDISSEQAIEVQVDNEQHFWGFNQNRALFRKTNALERKPKVLEEYGAAESVTVGQRSRYFDDLRNCRGLFMGLDPNDAIESQVEFACEYVKEYNHLQYCCIDERKLPKHLRPWVENYERIIAYDGRTIMYVQAAGSIRTFLEKTGDAARDAFFYQELAKLNEVIDPKYLTHAPTQQAVLDMLHMNTDEIERTARQIREENLRRMAESDAPSKQPDPDPTVYRVRMPG